jgi:hypothetical protein
LIEAATVVGQSPASKMPEIALRAANGSGEDGRTYRSLAV